MTIQNNSAIFDTLSKIWNYIQENPDSTRQQVQNTVQYDASMILSNKSVRSLLMQWLSQNATPSRLNKKPVLKNNIIGWLFINNQELVPEMILRLVSDVNWAVTTILDSLKNSSANDDEKKRFEVEFPNIYSVDDMESYPSLPKKLIVVNEDQISEIDNQFQDIGTITFSEFERKMASFDLLPKTLDQWLIFSWQFPQILAQINEHVIVSQNKLQARYFQEYTPAEEDVLTAVRHNIIWHLSFNPLLLDNGPVEYIGKYKGKKVKISGWLFWLMQSLNFSEESIQWYRDRIVGFIKMLKTKTK